MTGWLQLGLGDTSPSMLGIARPIRNAAEVRGADEYARDPLQTEFFLQEWLDSNGAYVREVPFARTDIAAYARAPSDGAPSPHDPTAPPAPLFRAL